MKKFVLYTLLATLPFYASCSTIGKYIRWGAPSFDPEQLELSELEKISSQDTLKTKPYSINIPE